MTGKYYVEKWWAGEDSNLRPMDYEGFDQLEFYRSVDLKELGRNYE